MGRNQRMGTSTNRCAHRTAHQRHRSRNAAPRCTTRRVARRDNTATYAMVGVIVAAALFGLTRKHELAPTTVTSDPTPMEQAPMEQNGAPMSTEELPPGHPPIGGGLPQGHPAVGSSLPPGHPPTGGGAGAAPAMGGAMAGMTKPEPGMSWKTPPRWELIPHASVMRISTYRIPKAAGDHADAELSVTRAGGDIDANAARWIGQFDAAAQKTARKSEKTVSALRVVIVEIEGAYSGMGPEAEKDYALLGAIVETPGQSHFFKMTGPAKSVRAARTEFDALVATFAPLP